jgi:hypothetical protein
MASNVTAFERRKHDRNDVCRQVREWMCDPGGRPSGLLRWAGSEGRAENAAGAVRRQEANEHLATCAACAVFAKRLAHARQTLVRSRPPGVQASFAQPDAGFPARVLARIERPADLLGWAAFRALPAALALALALAWLGLSAPASAPSTPATTAAVAAATPEATSALLEGQPSSEQLLAWSATPPETWP